MVESFGFEKQTRGNKGQGQQAKQGVAVVCPSVLVPPHDEAVMPEWQPPMKDGARRILCAPGVPQEFFRFG
jgi:hypothetical protein